MTLEERYQLSCYEDLVKLQDSKNIWLVMHYEEGNIYIKKSIELYNKAIYLRLMKERFSNIPEVILCVEEEGKLIVIEEYIHGATLKKIFEKQGILSQQRVIQIMISLCQTVEKLHGSNPPIIHRDIKPSNIMLSNDGVVKLIDFNAAKEFNHNQNEDTRLMGTQKFAAPEQYGFGQSDQRTDIYAMGVTMNYLLTGKFPQEELYSGSIGKIIKICISLEKNDRYQRIADLKADLILAEQSTQGKAGKSMAQVESEEKRNTNIFTKQLYKKQAVFPVGFRTGVLWKMLIAIYGYLLIFWLSINMVVTSSDGGPVTGVILWVNRLAVFVMAMGTVFFLGNYCEIQSQFPYMKKNKILRWGLGIVYLFIFYMLIFIVLAFLES